MPANPSASSSSSRSSSYESDASAAASSTSSTWQPQQQSTKLTKSNPGFTICISPHSGDTPSLKGNHVPEYPTSPSLLKHTQHQTQSFPFPLNQIQDTVSGLVSRRPSHSSPKRRITSLFTLSLALSIPVLGLLIAREWIKRDQRLKLWESECASQDLATRWGFVPNGLDYLKRGQDEQEDLEWEWYGNRDVGGPSPFDHIPQELPAGTERRRFLFLTGEWCPVRVGHAALNFQTTRIISNE